MRLVDQTATKIAGSASSGSFLPKREPMCRLAVTGLVACLQSVYATQKAS